MSAIARYFAVNNKQVAGYDNTPSKNTSSLEDIGVVIHFEAAVKNIPLAFLNKETTLVVYTPAIQKTHAELSYFFQNDFKSPSDLFRSVLADALVARARERYPLSLNT